MHLLNNRVKFTWAAIIVVIVMVAVFYTPFWSFQNKTTFKVTSSTLIAPVTEVARSKHTVTTIYPFYNDDPNHYLIQTKHFKLFGIYKVNYEHHFINNATDSISYSSPIIDGTQASNSFIAAINDEAIKQISYTDHVDAQGVIGLIQSDGSVMMAPSHNIDSYPQLIYSNGGFKKGTLTGKDEQGNIIFELEINLE